MVEVSDEIWAHVETAFNESKSEKTLVCHAEANGFK